MKKFNFFYLYILTNQDKTNHELIPSIKYKIRHTPQWYGSTYELTLWTMHQKNLEGLPTVNNQAHKDSVLTISY